jgi:hypothetical protein
VYGDRRWFVDQSRTKDRVVVAGRAAESDGESQNSRRFISLDSLTVAALRHYAATIDEERTGRGADPAHGLLAVYPAADRASKRSLLADSNPGRGVTFTRFRVLRSLVRRGSRLSMTWAWRYDGTGADDTARQ